METVILAIETDKQELASTAEQVKAKAIPNHELDKRKREVISAE